MGSTRLPGKSMMDLAGKPLIHIVIERLLACKNLDLIILATSNLPANDSLAFYVSSKLEIPVIRGDDTDVLSRFANAEEKYQTDYSVRVTADNPFISFEYIDKLIDFAQSGNLDYCNIDGLPLGLGAEIYKSAKLLEFSKIRDIEWYCREHTTPYFYEHPELYKIHRLRIDANATGLTHEIIERMRLTIDTDADLEVAKIIYSDLYTGAPIPTTAILNYCAMNLHIFNINSDIKQRHYNSTSTLKNSIKSL